MFKSGEFTRGEMVSVLGQRWYALLLFLTDGFLVLIINYFIGYGILSEYMTYGITDLRSYFNFQNFVSGLDPSAPNDDDGFIVDDRLFRDDPAG